MWAAVGSIVIGRHLFDRTNGWEGSPSTGDQVVVVSHRPKTSGRRPEASCHLVDDVAQAVGRASDLAGERHVAVALGLIDEVAVDVVPVVFGSGKRYSGSVDTGICSRIHTG